MYNALVLENIKKHGQRCDREIADETGISLIEVRSSIMALESIKAISSCNITNFEDGVAIEGEDNIIFVGENTTEFLLFDLG